MKRSMLALAACAASVLATSVPTHASPPTVSAARFLGRAPAERDVRFTLHMPLRNRTELESLVRSQADKRSPLYHHFLTPQQFRARYGIDGSTVARARAALGSDLRVVSVGSQDVVLAGTTASVERALGTRLWLAEGGRGRMEPAAREALHLPASLPGAAVIGLSTTVLRHPHSEVVAPSAANVATAHLSVLVLPHNELSPLGGYLTSDLKQAYEYPSYRTLTGRGATIAVLIDGVASTSDIAGYFAVQHLPTPQLTVRKVDGGSFTGDPNAIETTLDVQQSGGIAPGAAIVHYDIPDLSDASVYDGYKAIVEDDRADVVNSSFGACERYYSGLYAAYFGPTAVPATLYAQADLFAQGTAQGQTFVASSGDNGAFACLRPSYFQRNHPDATPILGVETPASDPYVAAVGGTNLVTSYAHGSHASAYVLENAYGDRADRSLFPLDWGSGGGESQLFAEPYYQQLDGIVARGRAVPDLAGHMGGCPGYALQPCGPDRSSDLALFGGTFINLIGTSASSPDFAGLVALAREAQGGRFGLIDGAVYAYAAVNGRPVPYYHDDVPGFNGLPTRKGYDEVTGVGSVLGLPFTGVLTGELAGDPGTPSNPGPSPATPGKRLTYEQARYPFLGSNATKLAAASPLASTSRSAVLVHDPMLALPPALRPLRERPGAITTYATTRAKGFRVCDEPCGGARSIGFAASQAYRLSLTDGLAIAADPALDAHVTVFARDGRPVPGWPKRLDDLFGATHLHGANAGDFRLLYNVRATFDSMEGRYWVSATELDITNGAYAIWIAESDGSNPTASWKSYQYALEDLDATKFATSGVGGFAVDAKAAYVSGDVEANDTVAIFRYGFVLAVDRMALERGKPQAAIGFRHLQLDGIEQGGLAPVQPVAPQDARGESGLFASTLTADCTFFCRSTLLWTLQRSDTSAALRVRAVPGATYQNAPDWSTNSLRPVTTQIRSTPVLSHGIVTLAFETGAESRDRVRTAIRWQQLDLAAGRERTSGTIVAPKGTLVDFGLPAADAAGNAYVAYVTFAGNLPSTIDYLEIDRGGRVGPVQTAFTAPAPLAYRFLTPGRAAAASIGSQVFFAEPYGADASQAGGVWAATP